MATLSVYKGTALNTTKVPVKDGQLLFETDTKKIWLDAGTQRLQVGGQDTIAWNNITSKPSYYDAKAIKSITRSGTTFTYTCLDGSTGTFTQQDNNTTYSAGTGLTLSGTTFSLNIAGAKTALGLGSNAYSSTAYLPLAGGTLSGNLLLQNGADLKLKAANGTDAGDIVFLDSSNKEYIRLWSQYEGALYVRFGENDTGKILIHDGNYTNYTVTKTGGGASGTWNININGNAGTATKANALSFSHGNEINFVGNSGLNSVFFNYRNTETDSAANNADPIISYVFCNKNGGYAGVTLYADNFFGNASTATIATKLAANAHVSNPMIFNWAGKDGQPTWLWGGDNVENMYVYNPSNFSVNRANSSNILNINNTASLGNCLQYIQTTSQTDGNDLPDQSWWHVIKMNHGTGDTYYKRLLAFSFFSNQIKTTFRDGATADHSARWKQLWIEGDSITGAVWNDYAEYRESTTTKPGLVVFENGDDTLSPTTKRLSHFAGIVSDTWGFCQGETERAKTPIAVAGRVLAYTYQKRNNYKPGDCVCAAPDGTVDIMTREEIIQYPDRIVGTVSCIPDYEEWGQGDRPAVKVDGRIWIKVN